MFMKSVQDWALVVFCALKLDHPFHVGSLSFHSQVKFYLENLKMENSPKRLFLPYVLLFYPYLHISYVLESGHNNHNNGNCTKNSCNLVLSWNEFITRERKEAGNRTVGRCFLVTLSVPKKHLSHIAEMGRELCTYPKFREPSKLDMLGNGMYLCAC